MRTCSQCGFTLEIGESGGSLPCPRCLARSIEGWDLQDGHSVRIDVERLRDLFPELEIVELIGDGGMGSVFRARHRKLGRDVALKVMDPTLGRHPSFQERFRREARSMAGLSHPGIVSVLDYGERDDFQYIVMEYVEGSNLRRRMDRSGIPADEARRILLQLCDAVAYAHERGLVHRDLKPENVLVGSDGRVKVTDFGLAALTEEDSAGLRLTSTAQIMGTAVYIAPEVLDGDRSVDVRTDVYSLGVLAYELFTGQVPAGRFAPPSEIRAVDPFTDQIVLQAVEKDRARRYGSVSELRRDLELLRSETAGPEPAPSGTAARWIGIGAAAAWVAWSGLVLVRTLVGNGFGARVHDVLGIASLIALGALAGLGVGWLVKSSAWEPYVRRLQDRRNLWRFGGSLAAAGAVWVLGMIAARALGLPRVEDVLQWSVTVLIPGLPLVLARRLLTGVRSNPARELSLGGLLPGLAVLVAGYLAVGYSVVWGLMLQGAGWIALSAVIWPWVRVRGALPDHGRTAVSQGFGILFGLGLSVSQSPVVSAEFRGIGGWLLTLAALLLVLTAARRFRRPGDARLGNGRLTPGAWMTLAGLLGAVSVAVDLLPQPVAPEAAARIDLAREGVPVRVDLSASGAAVVTRDGSVWIAGDPAPVLRGLPRGSSAIVAGDRIVTAWRDVGVWHRDTGTQVARVTVGGEREVRLLDANPDAGLVGVGLSDGSVEVLSLEDLRPVSALPAGPPLVGLSLRRDGLLAVADSTGVIRISGRDGGIRAEVESGFRSVGSLRCGTRSLVVSGNGLLVIDPESDPVDVDTVPLGNGRDLVVRLQRTLGLTPAWIASAAVDRSGTLIAHADGRMVSLRDASSGRLLLRFTGLARPVDAVAFGPDGESLVAMSRTGRDVLVWDLSRLRFGPGGVTFGDPPR